jgi:3-(3-hydroxy-phenyl)propionate hydroxylase
MAMTEHAVVITGGGPNGLMLAAELALANIDVATVERRDSQDLAGLRAGGLYARTIEVLDQRRIADRFLAERQAAQVAGFAGVRLDISDFPTRPLRTRTVAERHRTHPGRLGRRARGAGRSLTVR